MVKAAAQTISVVHPVTNLRGNMDGVMFTGRSTRPGDSGKNVVVMYFQELDRSPCSTGTSARMAAFFERKQLKSGQLFIHESILGTLFEGVIVEQTTLGNYPVIIPEITGSAYITGFHQFVVNNDDPLKDGFLIGR